MGKQYEKGEYIFDIDIKPESTIRRLLQYMTNGLTFKIKTMHQVYECYPAAHTSGNQPLLRLSFPEDGVEKCMENLRTNAEAIKSILVLSKIADKGKTDLGLLF